MRRNRRRGIPVLRTLVAATGAVLLAAACGPTPAEQSEPAVLEGKPASMLFDPERVGGLPVTEGPSGIRPDAPDPVTVPQNTDGGEVDRLAALAVDDIEEFWEQHYDSYLPGRFRPVRATVSYDSTDPDGPQVCGIDAYGFVNAIYCFDERIIAWDRGLLMPVGIKHFGAMGAVGVLAHEYGHALQRMSDLADEDTPILVVEQQADCLAGVYLRWVASGESPRFTLSTGDGLNHVLGGVIFSRDPLTPELDPEDGHGSALDRVSAVQLGFAGGPDRCRAIDMDEITARQGDLPQQLGWEAAGTEPVLDSPIDEQTLQQLMDVLTGIYQPHQPPVLSTAAAVSCPDTNTTAPVSYCPSTNTIHADMGRLRQLGEPRNELRDKVLVQGDNTALSVVTSRYAQAVQHERGAALDNPVAALRTACLTGVAQGRMTDDEGAEFILSAGDADEAVAGLLTNGLVASDLDGVPAPAGFSRILAYRLGLSSDIDDCFERFE
ncbi:peptidase [uncultured Mycolicibacterium sp.]|uniref:peptidase n=1 Tax=uncultured Mycolicibacterium sp. TaxID=2320817 RepID=UPI00262FD595|nr:peptidase [uncultured Mycolicibacterium sp.]